MALGSCTVKALLVLLAIVFVVSCSKQNQGNEQKPSSVLTSTPPFKTKEPDIYQAVRSITFTPADSGETIVITIAIARDGEMRREEDTSRGKRVVFLELPAGRFLLLPGEKIYATADGPSESTQAPPSSESPAEPYLHTAPIQSTYENLGSETVNGTTATKYRVAVNNSTLGVVSESETFVWVDEALGMPVKSSTRSAAGTRTMELSRITLTVDRALFEIPKDYQKVDARILRQRIR